MQQNDLIVNLMEILNLGDESKAKSFIIENIKNFPEDLQDEVIFSFLEEGITELNEESREISVFRKKALELVEILNKRKSELA